MASTLYLHWTATGYDWIRPGHYHSIVAGDGRVHRLHSYDVDLPAHTWRRNSNSVALACACMGGQPDPWTLPPTAAQLQSLRDLLALRLSQRGLHLAWQEGATGRPANMSLARVDGIERISPSYMRVTITGPDLGR